MWGGRRGVSRQGVDIEEEERERSAIFKDIKRVRCSGLGHDIEKEWTAAYKEDIEILR